MTIITNSQLSCPYLPIVNMAMQKMFNRTPRNYQGPVISHILKMMTNELPPEPILMVQPTGSGKSTVPLTCSVIPGGVTIILENTLALASDQTSKVKSIVRSNVKTVKSFQLDTFKAPAELERLYNGILKHIQNNSSSSIICFSSPETIVNPLSINFVKKLVGDKKLNLFCFNEIHLFVEFGISFWPQFQMLKDKIISLLYDNDDIMHVPILLMTATFDNIMFHLIQRMLGIQIHSNNIFWSATSSFKKRHIRIKMKYSNQVFKHTCDEISSHCAKRDDNKVVVISSTASRAADLQIKIDNWLDSKSSIKGDTILVIGDQETETKFAYTTEFTNTKFGGNDAPFSDDTLCPRFLLGTPGCIGAGLDCSSVNLVCRIGFPTSLLHFIQEMGRCGRTQNNDELNTYSIVLHLNDYVYLVERLYISSKPSNISQQNKEKDQTFMSSDEERKYYIDNLNKLCRMIFCEYGCWHVCLETISSNPFHTFNNIQINTPCLSQCPYCDKSRNHYIKAVCKQGLQSFLACTLMSNQEEPITPSILLRKLLEYPQVGRVIYGRQSALKAEKSSDGAITLLQLFACDIIKLCVKEGPNPKSFCVLSRTQHEPHYLLDQYWTYINHF